MARKAARAAKRRRRVESAHVESVDMIYNFCTPVWGHWHTDVFIRYALPSLLAEGNLPYLLDKGHSVRFHIATPQQSAERIAASPIYKKLAEIGAIHLHVLQIPVPKDDSLGPYAPPSDAPPGTSHHSVMDACHRHFLDLLRREEGNIAILLQADMISSRNFCRHIDRKLSGGKRFVLLSPQAFVADSVCPELDRRYTDEASGAIDIAPRDLIGLSLRDVHPYMRVSTWGQSGWAGTGAMFLTWQAPGAGWINHAFHWTPIATVMDGMRQPDHPHLIDCRFATDNSAPDMSDVAFMTDSDEGVSGELASVSYNRAGGVYLGGCGWTLEHAGREIVRMGRDVGLFGDPIKHFKLFSVTARHHAADLDDNWHALERQADSIIAEIIAKVAPAFNMRQGG